MEKPKIEKINLIQKILEPNQAMGLKFPFWLSLFIKLSSIIVLHCITNTGAVMRPNSPMNSNVTDIIVNTGDNVLLECADENIGDFHLRHSSKYKFYWCRSVQTEKSESRSTCFEGNRYFIANEPKISTVIYRCEVRFNHLSQWHSVSKKMFKLYVDQLDNHIRGECLCGVCF